MVVKGVRWLWREEDNLKLALIGAMPKEVFHGLGFFCICSICAVRGI